jgi:hypothetical protein
MRKFKIFLQQTNISDMFMFRIDAKKSSPEVVIDRDNNRIDITGNSTFENTSWFYSSLLKWAIAFNQEGAKTTTINIRLTRINDSSTKWLMIIMSKLYKLIPGHRIIVNWYYEPTNTNIQINGERIKLNSRVPVNLIAA